ncbi:Endonuclease-reverse transcriptase [Operophtera brumata]|uniref:Endonuclease-reverse transcriptase n=1 Tax=Operophtera brumata TaxID=104452 RepID=A0A0L7KWG9_OPEBR|nr:Endonuclease-reverse transcriptase [Operophtera brumata]
MNIYLFVYTETEEYGKRLDDFDKKLRQRNLILFGILEEEKSYHELEELVLQIINIKLEIECDRKDIEFVGRMGKKNTKPRPIRLALTTYGKKILQRKNALEGSGSYIKEDFPPKVLEIRKTLIPQLNEHRENGVKAILKYVKIIIKEKSQEKPKTVLQKTEEGA